MKKPVWWAVLVVAVVGLAAAFFYALQSMRPEPRRPAPPPAASLPEPKADVEPQIRHPIRMEEKPLPPLNESDAAIRDALAGLVGDRLLDELLNPQEFVRRVVATIDNLPRKKLAPRLMPVKPAAGQFLTTGNEDTAAISPANDARYSRYTRMVEALDAKKLVAVYAHFYPLFQQAYQDLGYPRGYFNDRLIEVIDNVLAAPEVQGPVKITRPKVFYQFADPELEALPAGQKILIRIGAGNATKVKAKLREIRTELTTRK
jgi:DUF3014 family protein